VVSEEPVATGRSSRWPWIVEVEEVCAVERLAYAPTIDDIGVAARSLSQQSHIRLSDEQGELAERLIREADAEERAR
jgi:hypothetical protein